MVSFITTSKALTLSTILPLALFASASSNNLRVQQSDRELQLCFIPFLCQDEEESPCPEVSPLNSTQFDLDKYIEKSWFIQRQQVNPYQSEDQLYCIVATYDRTDTDFIDVKNYGNNNQVNGAQQNSDDNGFFSRLCAKQVDAGELAVAPCFFGFTFDFFAGPYWVLAVGEDYSWAIVSGGAPDQPFPSDNDPSTTFCTTKEGEGFLDTNGSGLWLFSREQVASAATMQAMEDELERMGIYTGLLKNVTQEDCLYEGTTLKL